MWIPRLSSVRGGVTDGQTAESPVALAQLLGLGQGDCFAPCCDGGGSGRRERIEACRDRSGADPPPRRRSRPAQRHRLAPLRDRQRPGLPRTARNQAWPARSGDSRSSIELRSRSGARCPGSAPRRSQTLSRPTRLAPIGLSTHQGATPGRGCDRRCSPRSTRIKRISVSDGVTNRFLGVPPRCVCRRALKLLVCDQEAVRSWRAQRS
jgi:hypothetical protein